MSDKPKNKVTIAAVSSNSTKMFRITMSRSALCFLISCGVVVLTGASVIGVNFLTNGSPFVSKEIFAKQKADLLVDAIVRVRGYENDLKLRSSALSTLLTETLALDRTQISPLGEKASREEVVNAVGGGDEVALTSHKAPTLPARAIAFQTREQTLYRLDKQLEALKSVPLGAPVEGRISSGFGKRRSPFTRRWHKHRGLDIAVDRKSRVVATGDGKVVRAGYKGAYGRTVVIDHGNGIKTLYGHLSKVSVAVGEEVCRGQQIGFVGSTGRSTGPHLHYETRVDGVARDPQMFVDVASFLKFLS